MLQTAGLLIPPTISKLLERVVFDQIEEYLVQHSLLYELWSVFRAACSNDTCLTFLCENIRQQSKKNYTDMVLLDLQKTFDNVDHSILLSRLQCIGLGCSALK